MAGVLILADDLTGAADCAAAFLRTAPEVVVALDERARLDAKVLAIDLDTRNLSMEEACAKVARAFSRRRARDADILFKKIDSTLRGHVAEELAAARRSLKRQVFFAPAFPAQRRTVKSGRVFVDGKPLQGGNIKRRLRDADITVWDAETDSDLREIARKGLAHQPRPLFVGSAGLARALAAELPRRKTPRMRLPRGEIAVVVGSASPVSARQATRVAKITKREGVALYRLESTRAPSDTDAALVRAFGRIAAKHENCSAYVLTGGDTARAVLAARGVRGFRLLGEVEPGVPFGLSIPPGLAVCTKAGGFGGPDTLVHCVTRLKREMAAP